MQCASGHCQMSPLHTNQLHAEPLGQEVAMTTESETQGAQSSPVPRWGGTCKGQGMGQAVGVGLSDVSTGARELSSNMEAENLENSCPVTGCQGEDAGPVGTCGAGERRCLW